jgi:hypothetical protein
MDKRESLLLVDVGAMVDTVVAGAGFIDVEVEVVVPVASGAAVRTVETAVVVVVVAAVSGGGVSPTFLFSVSRC